MAFRIIIFYFHLFSISLSLSSLNPPLCNSHDSFALLQFKNSFCLNHLASTRCDEFYDDYYPYTIMFKNTSYPKTSSWGNDSNCCLWDGITCDSMSGHVIGLDLSCSWLQGQLHPNSTLFQLSHLQTLNLASNDFNGSFIPSQFGDLSTLMHLNVSFSNFVGQIPPKIAQLSQLVSLDLSLNYFDEWLSLRLEPSTWEKLIQNMTNLREIVLDGVNMSSIAPSTLSLLMNLSSSLVSLRLSDTELQGNITSDILCLENIQQLDLSDNSNLNGQLPKSNWSSPMSLLDLSYTNFFGEVPDSIGHLKHLNHLNLYECHFEGRVPSGLRNLTQLTYLYLGSNKFSGEIPYEISQLSNLVSLDMSFNVDENESSLLRFDPSTWEKMILNTTNLRELNLDYVNMSSVTPNSLSSLRNVSSSLTMLSIISTSLQGDITNAILCLENIKVLSLGENTNIEVQLSKLNWSSIMGLSLSSIPFSGEVPDSIGHLKSLEWLQLRDCQFEGHIPLSFKNLSHLNSLALSSNKFNGGLSVLSTLTQLVVLDLSSNKFSGGVSFLSALVNLTSLYLSNNSFSGEIPNVFGKLSQLKYLTLDNNNFSGQVPLSLSNTSVIFLDLSFNMLQGNLPIPLYGAYFFSVSKNKFSGCISFLFCNASSLKILDLSHNKLLGPIPQCLVGLPYLNVLDLQMNGFSGTLPNNFSKNNVLQTLHFNSNRLKGSLPQSLAYCNRLEIFDVGHNEIRDTFPSWIDDLPELQVLVLRENRFHGVIYGSNNTKHPFPKLRIFDLSNNHFYGSLPTTYIKGLKGMMKTYDVEAGSQYMGKFSGYEDSVMITLKGYTRELERILTIFTTIDLSNNSFDGEIPKAIGELHALIGLNLSHNRITGSIPKSIGKLINLEWLDLSCNKLEGEIPEVMMNLNFLAILNLSQNQLVGPIPSGKQFDTFQNDSYKGNLGLCGVPLTKMCKKDGGESPPSIFDSDKKFGFGWKPVALGYGCGMVFGIFMGYVMFSIGKPQWFVRIFEGQSKKYAKRRGNRAHAN